jgi:hypothetical protein
MLLHKFCDLFELRVLGGFKNFKQGHLGGAYESAFGGDFFQADIFI